MEAIKYTFDYLKSLSAVLVNTKIVVQETIIDNKIAVHKREYYKKRNGKICYVDYKKIWFAADWKRIKTIKSSKLFSSSENDWRPLKSNYSKDVINKDYKDELVEKFKELNNLNNHRLSTKIC